MKSRSYLSRTLYGLSVAVLSLIVFGNTAYAAAENATIIHLTQTGCQFLEPEGKDNHFKTKSSSDCEVINKKTGDDRLAKVEPLKLKPGKYIFRVSNKNVPYSLGFYFRGTGLGRLTLPSVSGGGLDTGVEKDYVIELKPGKYVYSCPLNPTPDYPVIVEG